MSPARVILVLFVVAAVAAAAWFLASGTEGAPDAPSVAAGATAARERDQNVPDPLTPAAELPAATNRDEVAAGPAALAGKDGAAAPDNVIETRITGRVIDDAQRPVADADVHLGHDWMPEGLGLKAATTKRVKSGADGRFAIDVQGSGDNASLVVEPPHHVRAKVDLPKLTGGDHDVGDVVTPLGGSITGRVLDEAGNALAGAEVAAWARGKTSGGGGLIMFGQPKENQRTANTDTTGFYRIDGLTPGDVVVLASKEGYTHESKKGVAVEAAGITNDVSLKLGRGAEIRGVVVDANGKAVEDAIVSVSDTVLDMTDVGFTTTLENARATHTDAGGAFTLSGLRAGDYNVTAKKDGFLSKTLKKVVAGTKDARLALAVGGSVWGIVSDDATGKPVGTFDLELSLSFNEGHQFFSGGSSNKMLTGAGAARVSGVPAQPGLYAFEVVSGESVELIAQADGYTKTTIGPIPVPAATTIRQDLALVPEITVSGIVRDPKGHAVANAQVHVTPVDPNDSDLTFGPGGRVTGSFSRRIERRDGAAPKVVLGDDVGKSATTDANGHYVIRGLSAGKFNASATHEEWAPSEAIALELAVGERREDVDVSVRAGGRLAGTAFDADGQPLAGARVSLTKAGGSGGQRFAGLPFAGMGDDNLGAVSDAKGHYEMSGVLPGGYRAELHGPHGSDMGAMIFMGDEENEPRGVALEIREGETTTQDLSLPPTGSVVGTVTAAGRPLAGVGVSLKKDGEMSLFPTARATTTERGEFELSAVEPGNYLLEVTPRQVANPITRDVEVRARSVTRENVTLPTGTIRGRVTDQDSNEGVAHVVLEIEPSDQAKESGEAPPRERRAVAMVMMSSVGDGGGTTTMRIGNEQDQVTTDDEGNFEALYLEPGDYTVSIRGAGVIPQKKERVRVFDGKPSEHVDFDAARGAIVKIKAVPGDGKELMFVHATLTSEADPGNVEDRGEVGGGAVTFDGLAPGRYTVSVNSEGQSGETTFEVRSGEEKTVEVAIR